MRSQTIRRSTAIILALLGIGGILVLPSYFLYNNFTQIFFDIINFAQNYPMQVGIIFSIGFLIGLALGRPSY